MGVARRVGAILVIAGSVVLGSGLAGAATDPEVERDGGDSTPPTTTVAPTPSTWTPTATSPATTSTTSLTSTTSDPTTTVADGSTTTSSTSTSSTTSSTVPAGGDIEQLPTFYLRGLCATPSGAFAFAMSNLGTAPLDVVLQFNGAPFDDVTLAPGEVYGFRTASPGTVVASIPGATFQAASVDAPCPIEPGSIGLGGLCRDAGTGYQWLLGNAGPDPVDVEIRLGGAVVGTFTVESGGFAGFTTSQGGQAQAFVAGQMVAESPSNDSPCVPSPASVSAACFAPGQGYRWFVSNDQEPPISVELRVGGVPQATLTLGPYEGREVTTAMGGLAELVVQGDVVASAQSTQVACDSPIGLSYRCGDAASGNVWAVFNGGPAPAAVRLVLNGVDVDTVTVAPGEELSFTTPDGGTMEAFVGAQLMATADSTSDPCVSLFALCTDVVDGSVWAVQPLRPVSVEVRVAGTVIATLDLTITMDAVQVATTLPGPAQVLIDGIVVDEAPPSSDPCVAAFAQCFDPANGYVLGVGNARDEPRQAELRAPSGATLVDLEPFGFVELAIPTGGQLEVFVDGQLVQTVSTSDSPCDGPAVFLQGSCFGEIFGGYGWELVSQRGFEQTVELRLDGVPAGSVVLPLYGTQSVHNPRPGTMQAFVNGVLVGEAPSSSDPCFGPPPSVAPVQLPATGGRSGPPMAFGLASVALGLIAVIGARRRPPRGDHRTLVRS